MQLFNRYVSPRGLTVFGCEILLIFGSVAIAARAHGAATNVAADLWKIALITGLCQICFYYNDLYDLTIVHSSRELLIRLLQAAGAASIIIALLYLLVPSLAIGDGIFISSLVIFLIAIVGWRLLFNRLAYSSQLEERVLIVGSGATARMVARQIQSQHDFGYRVVAFIPDREGGHGLLNPATTGAPEDIPRIVRDHDVDRIVVGLSDRRGRLPISELLQAKLAGVHVEDAATMYERLTGKILIDDLKPSWLIFSDGFVISRWTRFVKRAIDLALASVAFVLAAPLTLLTALAVYLDSDGPILYCQERVGEYGKTFTVYKFRSMCTDAERTGGPVWAKDHDDRVTRVGRFIRMARLDEIPQLWNVLRGDMSFVGPRPERPFFVEQLAAEIPFYQQRHAVKPGVTGWAQVKYQYGSSVEDAMEKLRYDLYYIKHISTALDLSIVFDTVKVILFGEGREVSGGTRWQEENGRLTFVRNVASRYVLIVVNALMGLVVLPYNVQHLGASAYGLWMLTTSLTVYFGVLDLGYGGAVVRFVAEYRARRDVRALNEILSTMFYVYSGIGIVCYLAAIGLSFLLPHLFNLDPAQGRIAQFVLLITAAQVALYFPSSVFGGVINGFQQYYINNVVGTISNITAALLNVLVLYLGYGLVELVTVTTLARTVPFLIYRLNAYRVFPELSLKYSYFRRDRLRELTGFSVYVAVIDWSARLIYATDTFFIGALINTAAVGVYAVAQRVADALLRLTTQLHTFLFPQVVHRAVEGSLESQRQLMIKATRFQLAVAVALCGTVAAVADVLIPAWVGRGLEESVNVLRLLAFVVVLRAWMAMPNTLLKGTGNQKFVAVTMSWAALANLLLSIPGTKMYGIVGCAFATVITSTVVATVSVFPRACRTVGMSSWQGYREMVWPAVWPAFVVVTLLVNTRHAIPEGLIAVLALMGTGGLLYGAIFFAFGLEREERQWITAAVHQLGRRRSPGLAAV